MITEYVDCTELKRLIEDKKIQPAVLKSFLRKKGIVFTASNAKELAEQFYTIFLGTSEISEIRDMLINDGNYEKSLVMNLHTNSNTGEDIIDILIDEISKQKAIKTQDYFIEQPTKTKEGACLQLSYIRKLPGRNRLLEEERRYLRLNIRKITNEEVVVDVRQQSATDSKNALGFIEKIAQSDENIGIRHINLEMLSSKNKVEFFDRIAAYKFKVWDLKTITGITVKQGLLDESEEEDIIVEDGEHASTLTGISQAVLNGSGLRSNEFVQESIKKGYYISAMRYRYTHKTDITEFAIVLSFKNQDLRVDIDKTYYEEDDGRIYVQPLIKTEQNEIIIAFQDVAYKVYNELISEQLVESTKLKS